MIGKKITAAFAAATVFTGVAHAASVTFELQQTDSYIDGNATPSTPNIGGKDNGSSGPLTFEKDGLIMLVTGQTISGGQFG
ncbi:MAG: hypothetical protein AAF762_07235, partial [Pseudomonadota bacterium]